MSEDKVAELERKLADVQKRLKMTEEANEDTRKKNGALIEENKRLRLEALRMVERVKQASKEAAFVMQTEFEKISKALLP